METVRALVAERQSPAVAAALPRGYFRLGDVLIVDLPLPGDEAATAQAYAEALRMRSVLGREGRIEGEFREPRLRLVWGDRRTETVHRESGFEFRLDPAQVMWSPGNLNERQRVATWDCRGQVVVDCFAGVGYFSIPIAARGRARRVIAIEKNPIAFTYLVENASRNHVDLRLEPVHADCRDAAPRRVADRVLLGLLPDSIDFVPLALEVLRPQGGWIHVHRVVTRTNGLEQAGREILDVVASKRFKGRIHHAERVKSYAPSTDHVVFDVEVRP